MNRSLYFSYLHHSYKKFSSLCNSDDANVGAPIYSYSTFVFFSFVMSCHEEESGRVTCGSSITA